MQEALELAVEEVVARLANVVANSENPEVVANHAKVFSNLG